MKPYSIFLLWFLLIVAGFFTSIADFPNSEISISNPNLKRFKDPAGRSLLSLNAKQDTALVASLDGTVHLVESHSGNVLWSFSSGSSIYSSYQALPDDDKENNSGLGGGTEPYLNDNYFVDIGDDWSLYMHNKHFGKTKVPMTVEEYVSSTPHISEDGGITLGSKKTTVYLVDARSGAVIYAYKSDDSPLTLGVQSDGEKPVLSKQDTEDFVESSAVDLKTVEPLYITRTDYALQSFAPSSGKVLWNMTVAEIGAAFLCQGIENSFSGGAFNLRNELGLEYEGDFEMPLPCQTKAIVARIRDRNLVQSFSQIGRLPMANNEGEMLPLPAPDRHSLQPKVHHQGELVLPLPPPKIENPGILDIPSENKSPRYSNLWKFALGLITSPKILSYLAIFLPLVLWYMGLLTITRKDKSTKQLNDSRGTLTVGPKRKKARKLGNNKNSGSTEMNDKNISSEKEGVKTNGIPRIERNDKEPWLDLTKPVDGGVDGRRVGKLFVSNIEIAKGSNGTVVLEGIYDGRPVAVKRLVQVHHDVAFKEIQNLIASDRHSNIVRWYGVEYDSDFVYLALERCNCSLNDLIQMYSDSSPDPVFTEGQGMNSINEYNVRLDSIKGINKDIELWKANCYPSLQLLKLMRDVVSGLAHLHELGIIHRDLKPQNVLIINERSLCAKLSDMGISKRLLGDMSSLGHHATGYGSSGWQAPEQLLHGRQTRAVDLFSLGCVLFFCITGGKHPFGDRLERDINIVKNRIDLFMVEHIPEAVDLFSHLLDPIPELRPKAVDVLHHPLFWSSEMRLSFLRDTSDRVELEDRENESDVLTTLEDVAPVALGGKWDEKMETAFITNIGRYRRYKYDSTRDLLRVIRNKFNHYRELPKEIQEILGPVPEGFDCYFASRFPRLLIEVYKVVYKYCRDEECFWKYFKSNPI